MALTGAVKDGVDGLWAEEMRGAVLMVLQVDRRRRGTRSEVLLGKLGTSVDSRDDSMGSCVRSILKLFVNLQVW